MVMSDVAPDVQDLFRTVVEGGYCIGCGACAALPGSPIDIRLNEFQEFQAALVADGASGDLDSRVLEVCPFANAGPDEDAIASERYPTATIHPQIGRHIATYVGYVSEPGFRDRGSSGGMGAWLLAEFMRRGLVDGVIHVRDREATEGDPRLFEFAVSTLSADAERGAKSRYAPVELSQVLRELRAREGRYAIIGVPCFIKAVRRLALVDDAIASRVTFTVGLFCGHLKSGRFADLFGWQAGFSPGTLSEIDFRHKLKGRPANRYGVKLIGKCQRKAKVVPVDEFFGYVWGHSFMKYSACDYCDDVVGETADVSIGDAWLPDYVEDSEGTNVVVVRDPSIGLLVDEAIREGRLALEPLSPDAVASSQDASFRHRRVGLAYRLALKDRAREWRPEKRVRASTKAPSRRYRRIFRLRMKLTECSRIAFREAVQADDWSIFARSMSPLVNAHDRPSGWRPQTERVARRVLRPVKRVLVSGKASR